MWRGFRCKDGKLPIYALVHDLANVRFWLKADISERQSDGSFSLSVSLPNPVPATNIFRGFWGESVNLIGSGQMTISRMGNAFEGGGAVFVYDID